MPIIKTKKDFEKVFKQYFQMCCNSVISVVGDKHVAQDVVQDVMIHLWKNRRKIGEVEYMRSFLLTSCRNKAIEYVRKSDSNKRLNDHISNTPITEDINVEQTWLQDRIYNSIRQLPPKCGQVFSLSKVEGLTYSEIAETMDISVKTVENHMAKAFRLLRDLLKDQLHHH